MNKNNNHNNSKIEHAVFFTLSSLAPLSPRTRLLIRLISVRSAIPPAAREKAAEYGREILRTLFRRRVNFDLKGPVYFPPPQAAGWCSGYAAGLAYSISKIGEAVDDGVLTP